MKKIIMIVSCLWLMVSLTQAQEATRKAVLMNQARNGDREQRIGLLQAFESGDIPVDAESIQALAALAGLGTIQNVQGSNVDHSDIRARSIHVLGDASMTDEALDTILHVLDAETHTAVLSASFIAIGKLGSGSDPIRVLRVMNGAMLRDMARRRSNSVADDYLTTIANFVSPSNRDLQTIDVITRLSQGRNGYSHNIRMRAMELLRSLW